MSETLSVTVNRIDHEIPNTVSNTSEFFESIGWGGNSADDYNLYLIDGNNEIGPLGSMLVIDDNDEYVAVPKYVDDGG